MMTVCSPMCASHVCPRIKSQLLPQRPVSSLRVFVGVSRSCVALAGRMRCGACGACTFVLTQAKAHAAALAMFEDALTLPGTGQKKFTDKPAEISDGERATALYNIACCHCQLEGKRACRVRRGRPPSRLG